MILEQASLDNSEKTPLRIWCPTSYDNDVSEDVEPS